MKKERIAFVGVGRMGANMARRLKDCGYEITAVNDVDKEVAAALAEELGARYCESLSELTAAADVVFTVVSNDTARRSMISLPHLAKGSSTSPPSPNSPFLAVSKAI